MDLVGAGDDVMAVVGRHWAWVLAFGVLSVVAGVLVAVWPHITLIVAAVIFGIQLIVNSVFRFISAFAAPAAEAWARVLAVIIAVLSLIAGLYLLRHPYFTVAVLGLILGFFWIVAGAIDIFTALAYRELPGRWMIALLGVLGVIAGIVVVASPVTALLFLTLVMGIWLILFGLITIYRGFTLMRAARGGAGRPSSAT